MGVHVHDGVDARGPRMAMSRWVTTVVAAAGSAALAFVIGRTARSPSEPATPAPAAVSPEARTAAARRVQMPASLADRAGVRIARVQRRMLTPSIELSGSVDFDADRVADVGGRIAGRITRIFVRPGANVVQGQPLAEIESAVLGEAIAQYLSARANLIAARANARRESGLAAQSLSTAVALEQARAREQALSAEIRGAEQRLLAMGASPSDLRSLGSSARNRHITLRAPIDGRVVTRPVVLGQVVEPTSTVVRIADLRGLWVQLDVFERNVARVAPGNFVEIMSETHPGRTFHGTVQYVDSTIDVHTRTARVRIEVDNSELLLRPGQFVVARLYTGGSERPIVAIPRTAMVQMEGRPSAFVRVSDAMYELRTLGLGVSEGDSVEVLHGIDDGDQLVVEGAFALKSELER